MFTVPVGGTQVTNSQCLAVLACSPPRSHLAGCEGQHSRAKAGTEHSEWGMGCCARSLSPTGQHTLFQLVRRKAAFSACTNHNINPPILQFQWLASGTPRLPALELLLPW